MNDRINMDKIITNEMIAPPGFCQDRWLPASCMNI